MRYSQYEARMQRIAAVIAVIKRHRVVLCSALAGITLLILTYLCVQGMVLSPVHCESVTYGEPLSYGATSLFSTVSYSFAPKGSEEFTSEEPAKVGSYVIRAQSNIRFLNIGISEAEFTISPKTLEVTFLDTSAEYKSTDRLATDCSLLSFEGLTYEDRAQSCMITFSGEMVGKHSGSAMLESLVIVNEAGEDVTYCYMPVSKTGTLQVYRKKVHVYSLNEYKEYDGMGMTGALYQVDVLYLPAPGHEVIVTFVPDQNPRPHEGENRFTVQIVNEKGIDVSENYQVDYTFGILGITPRKITVRSWTAFKTYDGTPLVKELAEIYEGTLVKGHKVQFTFGASITEPGTVENTFKTEIFDEENMAVTAYYEIEQIAGTLIVYPKELTIETGSGEKYYDGKPLVNEEWTLRQGSMLAEHVLLVSVTGIITDVGSVPNSFTSIVHDGAGRDVSHCYQINGALGTLTVKPNNDATVPIKPESGKGDFNPNDNATMPDWNVNGDTQISRDTVTPSDITVLQIYSPVTTVVYLRDRSYGDYNGNGFGQAPAYQVQANELNPLAYTATALKNSDGDAVTLSIERIFSGFVLPCYTTETLNSTNDYNVNSNDKKYEVAFYLTPSDLTDLRLKGYEGQMARYEAFVSQNYTAVPSYVTPALEYFLKESALEKTAEPEEIAAAIRSYAKYSYDYKSIPQGQDVVSYFLKESRQGICQHFAAAGVMIYRYLGYPARYVTGYYAGAVADHWVNVTADRGHAWVEVYIKGLGWTVMEVTGSSLSGGGSGASGGSDDNSQDDQPIQFYKELTLQSGSAQKIYDGVPLRYDGCWIKEGFLDEGHIIEMQTSGVITAPGTTRNKIIYTIRDEKGRNVTALYKVNLQEGSLTVDAMELEIHTASSEKTYDGKPHSAEVWWIAKGGLLAGHYVEVSNFAQLTEPASTENRARFRILNGEGTDVSNLYKIKTIYGTLCVKDASDGA